MPPSAIDEIITAVAIFKCKLVYGLCTIVKCGDQWMTKMIAKRSGRIIRNSHSYSAILFIVLDIVCTKEKIIMILILYHRWSPHSAMRPFDRCSIQDA